MTDGHVVPTNPSGVIIRPGAPGDLPAVGRLGALLVRLHHELDPPRFIPAGPETERAYASYLGTQLDKPRVVVLVAERGGEVIGYTYAGVEGHDYMALRGPAGVLYDIVVDPLYRGNGVGWSLLDATMAALKAGALLGSCCQQPRGTWRRGACSLPRDFDRP